MTTAEQTTPAYLTVPQLAESLGVDAMKVLGWIHRGELQAIDVSERRGGRPRWRIPVAAWQAFQAARSNQASIPAPRQQRRRRRVRDESVIEFYK